MTGVVARRKPWRDVKPGDYLVLDDGREIVVTFAALDIGVNNDVRVTGRVSYAPTPIKKMSYFDRHDADALVSVIMD